MHSTKVSLSVEPRSEPSSYTDTRLYVYHFYVTRLNQRPWENSANALPFPAAARMEDAMSDHVYKVVELVGSSKDSIEDAIQTAIKRASQSLRDLRWVEVVQTRGHIENGEVQHYQVVLKAGFTLEGEYPL